MKKNKKLVAQVQALKNQLNTKENKNKDIEIKVDLSKLINRDIIQTLILVLISFAILISIYFLDANFFFNKFF
jgi:hypothetical protein